MKHAHNNEQLTKEIELITRELKQSETLKIQSETQLKTLRTQYKKVEGEIEKDGVDPKKATEVLEGMDTEILEMLNDIKQLMTPAQ